LHNKPKNGANEDNDPKLQKWLQKVDFCGHHLQNRYIRRQMLESHGSGINSDE
jgi:hypothetical protein